MKPAKRDNLLHDLKGPITNARGFQREIGVEIAALKQTMEYSKHGMEAYQVQGACDLIEGDILPLLECLHQVIDTLENRVKEFEKQ